MAEINANVKYGNLKKLAEEMAKNYSVKVGLLANKGGSEEVSSNLDMAGLGAVQEFGCTINVTEKMRAFLHYQGLHLKPSTKQITIPARSWLQKPIERSADLRKKIREKTGLIKEDLEIAEYLAIEKKDLVILKNLAYAVATSSLELIDEAFETSGFGEWQPNSSFTIEQKGSAMPLIDKGSHGGLRGRINYDIEEV